MDLDALADFSVACEKINRKPGLVQAYLGPALAPSKTGKMAHEEHEIAAIQQDIRSAWEVCKE
jgi:hypothetical protein